MRLHDLSPNPGATKERKRLGRGNSAGQGTTAGKGTKGQKARSGGLKAGFRGMSSRNQRMAKRRGFNNKWRTEYDVVNVGKLGGLAAGSNVDVDALKAARLVRGDAPVKVLGDGDLKIALTFVGLKVTAGARQKIEAAGGTVSDGAPEGSSAPAPTAAAPTSPERMAEAPVAEEEAPAASEPVESPEPDQEDNSGSSSS
jgi:large subunit ribosomal protein L15